MKKIMSIFLSILLLLLYTGTVMARRTTVLEGDVNDSSVPVSSDTGNGTGVMVPPEVENTLVDVTRILLLIGTAVCIGKIIHIGILMLTSTAVDKSNAKQALFPWILGTIICFGAATIGNAVIKVFLGAGLPSDVLGY